MTAVPHLPERSTGVSVPVRRGTILEVLSWLHGRAPAGNDPDAILFEASDLAGGPVVLVRFDHGPAGVLAWAKALGFPRPTNSADLNLRQVIVQSRGCALGWQVEIRHVHTDPSTAGRREADVDPSRRRAAAGKRSAPRQTPRPAAGVQAAPGDELSPEAIA